MSELYTHFLLPKFMFSFLSLQVECLTLKSQEPSPIRSQLNVVWCLNRHSPLHQMLSTMPSIETQPWATGWLEWVTHQLLLQLRPCWLSQHLLDLFPRVLKRHLPVDSRWQSSVLCAVRTLQQDTDLYCKPKDRDAERGVNFQPLTSTGPLELSSSC